MMIAAHTKCGHRLRFFCCCSHSCVWHLFHTLFALPLSQTTKQPPTVGQEAEQEQQAANQRVARPSDGQPAAMANQTTAESKFGGNGVDAGGGAGGESSSEDDLEWALRSPVERARDAAQSTARTLDGEILSSSGSGSGNGSGDGNATAEAAKERQLNAAKVAERQLNAEFLNMNPGEAEAKVEAKTVNKKVGVHDGN